MFSWPSNETVLTGLSKLYTKAPSDAYLATFDTAVLHCMILRHLVPESAPGTCLSLASFPSGYGNTTGGIIMRFLYTIWVPSTHCSPIRLVPLFSCTLHLSENCQWRFNLRFSFTCSVNASQKFLGHCIVLKYMLKYMVTSSPVRWGDLDLHVLSTVK